MVDFLAAHFGLAVTGLEMSSLLMAGAALAFGYTVFGMTGFGSAVVAMPLLTQLMPLRTAVPIMLLCDLVAGLLLGASNRSAVHVPELRRVVPWMLTGILAGLGLLMYAPERPLLLVLGVGVLLYSLWRLSSSNTFKPLRAGWVIPLGIGGGGFTAMFGTGGPLYTIYLAGRLQDRNQLRATVGTLIMLTGLTRLILFAITGLLLKPAVAALAIWLVPCGVLGMQAGAWLRNRVPAAVVARLLWIILIASSLSLIARALSG
jgi:uncharacterized membrane protein YfcA